MLCCTAEKVETAKLKGDSLKTSTNERITVGLHSSTEMWVRWYTMVKAETPCLLLSRTPGCIFHEAISIVTLKRLLLSNID